MKIVCANCGRGIEVLGEPGATSQCQCGNRITVPDRPPKHQFGVANCTNCWKRYGVVGRPPGTRFRCKACGEIITIREPGKPVSSRVVVEPEPARRQARAPAPKRPAEEQAEEVEALEEAEEAEPAPEGRRVSARGGGAAEALELRSALKKQKAAAEAGAADARESRARLDEKSRTLEEKEAELARVMDDVRGLQERTKRQSDEIASLQLEVTSRTEQATSLGSRVEELEGEVAKRDEEIASRDARVKELEEELARRPTREETEAFVAEKAEMERRLEAGGMKVAALRDAVAGIRGPLAEALARFDALGAEAEEIGLPDFASKLAAAEQEAESAKAGARSLEDELAAVKKDLTAARRRQDEILRTAEEELEKLSSTDAGERKGFLRGLFGKKGSKSESSARLRAVASKLKLKAAGSAGGEPGEPDLAEEAESMEDVEFVAAPEPVGDAEPVEMLDEAPGADRADADGTEEAEPVEDAAPASPEPEDAEDAEDAEEVEDVEDIEEAAPAEPPKGGRRRKGATAKGARTGRRRRR